MSMSDNPTVLRNELTDLRRRLVKSENGQRHKLAMSISHRERKLQKLRMANNHAAMEGASSKSPRGLASSISTNAPCGTACANSKIISGKLSVRSGAKTLFHGTFSCPAGVSVSDLFGFELEVNGSTGARVFFDLD